MNAATMGIVRVAEIAARAVMSPPTATSTATGRTNSAACSGSRS